MNHIKEKSHNHRHGVLLDDNGWAEFEFEWVSREESSTYNNRRSRISIESSIPLVTLRHTHIHLIRYTVNIHSVLHNSYGILFCIQISHKSYILFHTLSSLFVTLLHSWCKKYLHRPLAMSEQGIQVGNVVEDNVWWDWYVFLSLPQQMVLWTFFILVDNNINNNYSNHHNHYHNPPCPWYLRRRHRILHH